MKELTLPVVGSTSITRGRALAMPITDRVEPLWEIEQPEMSETANETL